MLVILSNGCRTLHRLPPVDVSAAGWTLRQGQAVWRETTNAPGIAGEIVVAMHAQGDSTVQFTKTPLPFLAGQRTAQAWHMEFIPQKQIQSGTGAPPSSLLWLWLPAALGEATLPSPLQFRALPEGTWELENTITGESIRGFILP